jgi:serine/threonine protein kinase
LKHCSLQLRLSSSPFHPSGSVVTASGRSHGLRDFMLGQSFLTAYTAPHSSPFSFSSLQQAVFLLQNYVRIFISGGTLTSEVKQLRSEGNEIPIGEVVDYGIQMAEQLGHAHQRGIIRRDVKSDPAVLSREGNLACRLT